MHFPNEKLRGSKLVTTFPCKTPCSGYLEVLAQMLDSRVSCYEVINEDMRSSSDATTRLYTRLLDSIMFMQGIFQAVKPGTGILRTVARTADYAEDGALHIQKNNRSQENICSKFTKYCV